MSTRHESRTRGKDRVANPSTVGNEYGGRPGHLSWIVGGVAAAVVFGIGYKTMGGSEADTTNASPLNTEPGVSGPVVPGPGEVEQEVDQEAIVGQPGSTLENISVKPSQELIDEALQPVTVEKFPTPEAALEQFGRIDNIIYLSADVDTSGTIDFPETEESKDRRIKLYDNMYSDNGFEALNDPNSNVPQLIGMELFLLNESGAIATGGKTGTFHSDWTVQGSAKEIGENTYQANVEEVVTTNFTDLDDTVYRMLPNLTPRTEFLTQYTVKNDGNTWEIDEFDQLSSTQ